MRAKMNQITEEKDKEIEQLKGRIAELSKPKPRPAAVPRTKRVVPRNRYETVVAPRTPNAVERRSSAREGRSNSTGSSRSSSAASSRAGSPSARKNFSRDRYDPTEWNRRNFDNRRPSPTTRKSNLRNSQSPSANVDVQRIKQLAERKYRPQYHHDSYKFT